MRGPPVEGEEAPGWHGEIMSKSEYERELARIRALIADLRAQVKLNLRIVEYLENLKKNRELTS